jgi:hypothetical protein
MHTASEALSSLHHIAVGMTKNEQELFRMTWLRRRFPAEVEKVGHLNQALGHVERAIPIFTAYAEALRRCGIWHRTCTTTYAL